MSEPHIIIEGSITWDTFLNLCQKGNSIIRSYYYQENKGFVWPRSYVFQERDVKIQENGILFYNGPYLDLVLLREDNLNIEHGLGSLYVYNRQYDEEATGEFNYDDEPIFKKLPTFKLAKRMIEIWERKPTFLT